MFDITIYRETRAVPRHSKKHRYAALNYSGHVSLSFSSPKPHEISIKRFVADLGPEVSGGFYFGPHRCTTYEYRAR
jgi:hypothetical protein